MASNLNNNNSILTIFLFKDFPVFKAKVIEPIRGRLLLHLIWDYTVCQCPFKEHKALMGKIKKKLGMKIEKCY